MPEPFVDSKSGNYFVSFSFKGRRYKRSTGCGNLTAAKRTQRIVDGRVSELKTGLTVVPEGVDIADFIFEGKQQPDPGAASDGISVEDMVTRYLAEAAPPNKAQSTHDLEKVHTDHLKEFAKEQGVTSLADLDRDFFEAYKRWRHGNNLKNVTINKELGTFRTMMNSAVKSGLIERNPLDVVKWLKEDVRFERFRTGKEIEELAETGDYDDRQIADLRRFRYLTEEEVHDLLESAQNSPIYAFIAVAAYTGMRLSEIRRLAWADVDLQGGRILARGSKGSQSQQESPRYISLHPKLGEILKARKANASGALVFGDEDGNEQTKDYLYYHLSQLTDGTDFDGIRFHVLRHSFASNLAAKGVDQRVIDSFMGHQTEAMRKRYQHLFPEDLQAAVEELGF
jgi:integrase